MALERFGVSMDEELLAAFDAMLTRKGYANRSECLRDLVRHALVADAADVVAPPGPPDLLGHVGGMGLVRVGLPIR